jgi:Uri superfamily endonuclease
MKACTKICRTVKTQSLPASGTYTVLLWLPATCHLTIGRLGCYTFPRGYYTYTGSAKRSLAARLHRHLHGATTRHWHIDYLRPQGRILAWRAYAWGQQPECQLNQQLARHGEVVVPKFGASDCACHSHLLFYPGRRRPLWQVGEKGMADLIGSWTT